MMCIIAAEVRLLDDWLTKQALFKQIDNSQHIFKCFIDCQLCELILFLLIATYRKWKSINWWIKKLDYTIST